MPRLRWRTYRTEGDAPIPVASAEKPAYRLDHVSSLPNPDLSVRPFDEAWLLDEGTRLGSGDSLPAEMLASRPVLIAPSGESDLNWVPARPLRPSARATAYNRPRFIEAREVIVPGRSRPSDEELRLLDAEALQDGAFRVKPGIIGPVRGRVESGEVNAKYDPVTGLISAETPGGDPLPANAQFQLILQSEETMRTKLEEKEQAIVDPDSREPLAIARQKPQTVHDRRRLPAPTPETQWHALDQAHYDASPVSTDDLWIIETDAPREDVRDAVRRTLPSGSMFRVEPYEERVLPERDFGVGNLFLDLEPAAIGYSLGLLRATYDGPVIKARRGTGTTHPVEFRDFTAEEIADGTLGDWASGADGRAFLYRFYDQSGNERDTQQPALEKQPLLAENGRTITAGGRSVAKQRGGGFFQSLPQGGDFTIALVGGAQDFSGDPVLAEADTGENTETRFVIVGDSGNWKFTEQKFLGTNIVYGENKGGELGTHVVKMKDENVWASFDGEITNEAANEFATHQGFYLLNDATGNKQGGFIRSAVAYQRVVDIDTRDRLLSLFQNA